MQLICLFILFQSAPSFLVPHPLQINTKTKAQEKFQKETQLFSYLTPMATRKLIRDFFLSKRSLLLPSPQHQHQVPFISQIYLSVNCLIIHLFIAVVCCLDRVGIGIEGYLWTGKIDVDTASSMTSRTRLKAKLLGIPLSVLSELNCTVTLITAMFESNELGQ